LRRTQNRTPPNGRSRSHKTDRCAQLPQSCACGEFIVQRLRDGGRCGWTANGQGRLMSRNIWIDLLWVERGGLVVRRSTNWTRRDCL
jgi:hypothetical protein